MAKRRKYTATFSSGVVGDEFLAQPADGLNADTLKEGLNTILVNGGGCLRRPGSYDRFDIPGRPRLRMFDIDADNFRIVVFTDDHIMVVQVDGTIDFQMTGVPWTEADLDEMTIEIGDQKIYIFSTAFAPQEFTFINGVWSLNDLDFSTGIGGSVVQPYFRYAPKGVTMTLGGFGGSVSMSFDQDVLDADHVGTRFRYIDKELLVTAVTDAQNATVTVQERPYPTVTVTMPAFDIVNFKVGHEVTGDTTGVRAQIVSVSGATFTAVNLNGYEVFDVSEKIVSPDGASTPTSVVSDASPASTSVWDEQMISPVYGFPSIGRLHRNRLIIAGFPGAKNYIAASAIGVDNDFGLGSDDDDAFIEPLGDEPNADILHIVSTEQLIILTNRGCYYVPESEAAPLSPTRVSFNQITPDGASKVEAVLVPEGVIFIDTFNRVLLISQTRSVRGSWSVGELSTLANHLLTDPRQITYIPGIDTRAERLIIILNGDSSSAVMSYRRGAESVGMTEWKPAGDREWGSFLAWQGLAYIATKTGDDWRMEELSFQAITDGQREYETVRTELSGTVAQLVKFGAVSASGVVTPEGKITDNVSEVSLTIEPFEGLQIGFDFNVRVQPSPPSSSRIGSERRRISRAWLSLLDTGPVRINGDLDAPNAIFDGPGPNTRTGETEPYFKLGWDREETILVEQKVGEGAPFLLRAITMEISY